MTSTPTEIDKAVSVSSSIDVNVKTVIGKTFSVERYYMLSEIEQQAFLPVYLNDYGNNEEGGDVSVNTEPTMASEIDDQQCVKLPPFIVLYMLWNCCSENGSGSAREENAKEKAESFKRGVLEKALCKLQSLSEKVVTQTGDDEHETKGQLLLSPLLQNVYVIVDVLIGSESENDDNDDEGIDNNNNGWREERFQKNLAVVEALAQTILLPHDDERKNKNESPGDGKKLTVRLFGATLGLADHPRAAPGLESCLEAISVGARDRRRRFGGGGGSSTDNSEEESENARRKSCVGIVCHSLQDLVGYDEETETDAVQGVMQSLTHVSFANNGKAPATSTNKTATGGGGNEDENENGAKSTPSPPSYRPPILKFAHKAHKHWRVHKGGLPPEPTPEEKRAYEEYGPGNKSNFSILVGMLVFIIAYWWNKE
jgi:hypothetical protein